RAVASGTGGIARRLAWPGKVAGSPPTAGGCEVDGLRARPGLRGTGGGGSHLSKAAAHFRTRGCRPGEFRTSTAPRCRDSPAPVPSPGARRESSARLPAGVKISLHRSVSPGGSIGSMRKLVTALGAVLACLLLAGLAGFWALVHFGDRLDAEAKAYVDK